MNDKIAIDANKQPRQSNLELYRIVCMLLILAHHYAGIFGVLGNPGPAEVNPFAPNSLFIYLFGMWGKTGINCFILITGYFMCTSSITFKKFLKLYLWVITYNVLFALIFIITGYQSISYDLLYVFFPFLQLHSDNFVSSFFIWWLFIPFLNILVDNLNSKKHLILILLLVLFFSIYPLAPMVFKLQGMNPICWFSTLYIIASYIRKYPGSIYRYTSCGFWGLVTLLLAVFSMISVVAILWVNQKYNLNLPHYHFVSDSHKLMALLVAVSSFMCFKNLKIGYSKLINVIGGSTFGVLLIHSNSSAMRQWLWADTLNCANHFYLPFPKFVLYSVGVVLLIFALCIIIDRIRIKAVEEPFFKWYNHKHPSRT